jgi:hypothetical protein
MDAIECGIVKLPRVPVAENIPGDEMPMFRNFDETAGNSLPRPNTLLIDSEQLEAGDALDDNSMIETAVCATASRLTEIAS